MRQYKVALIVTALLVVASCALEARAVGWDSDDFIITGAPNFPDRIGIFDHDFTFKGYLEQNFIGVQGMDFDALGNLVAIASLSTSPEVRLYNPDGNRVGGFTSNDPTLQYTGDIKVAPDGNYALGSYTTGVRVYTPQGSFVRQYGNGDSRGIEYVPGNRLWSGGAGTIVKIFDTVSGAEIDSFIAHEQTMSYSMQYSPVTSTVLVVDADRDAGAVFERDLAGDLLQEFHVPVVQVGVRGATRGPNGDVFGTTSHLTLDVVHWRPDGTVAGTLDVYPFDIHQVRIIWAGIVPEPTGGLIVAGLGLLLLRRTRRQNL